MDLDKTLIELADKVGIKKEKLVDKINEKLDKFSGVITKEGALYMVTKELGIDFNNHTNITKIKDVKPSSKKITIVGRVFKISSVREFVRSNGMKGKVVNLSLSDGTGHVKLPLWDEQTNLVEEGLIGLGSIIEISNAMSKENNFGELELSLGKFSNIKQADDTYEFPPYEELVAKYFSSTHRRASIKDVRPGNTELSGVIVQVFKGKFLFENSQGEAYLIVSCVIDDGTGNTRVVFFRELAEQLAELTVEDLKIMEPEKIYGLISDKLLGKEIVVQGRVSKNLKVEKLEMIASSIKSLNVLEESKRLVDLLETTIGV